MELPFVIAFQTCDRIEYTRCTLYSFNYYHPFNNWIKYYADDASNDTGMRSLVESFGFKPLILHSTRRGMFETSSELIEAVQKEIGGRGTVLYLQNDFQFLRAIPIDVIDLLLDDGRIGWVRLAGRWKNVLCGEQMIEDWCKDILPAAKWKSETINSEDVEIGRSYFCHNPPPVASIRLLASIMGNGATEYESVKRASKMKYLTARFINSVTAHIGQITTSSATIMNKRTDDKQITMR